MADPALEMVRDSPGFKILIDGAELPEDALLDVLDVKVCDYVEGAHTFHVTFNNWDSDLQDYKWFEKDLLREGAGVEIRVGFVDSVEALLEGEITCLEPEFHETETPTLKVSGYDKLHRLRRGRKSRTFAGMKDSEIAEQIARDLNLTPRVEDSSVVHDYVFQYNQSDLDFLLERARRIRYELIIRDGTLLFRRAANDESGVLAVTYGQTLQSFYPRLSTLGQVSEFVVLGWDPKTKEPIEGRAGAGSETTKMGASRLGVTTAEQAFFATESFLVEKPTFSTGEARQIAEARFEDMSMRFITGEGEAIGDPGIRAGQVVELLGLGPRFSGLYYVTASEHRIDPETGYTTRFSVERNAT